VQWANASPDSVAAVTSERETRLRLGVSASKSLAWPESTPGTPSAQVSRVPGALDMLARISSCKLVCRVKDAC
jgi:hypothetical protein